MDVSEIYQKMCDCPEIQREMRWADRGQQGMYLKGDFFLGEDGGIHIAGDVDNDGNCYTMETFEDEEATECTDSIFAKVWLPRQDQLQEMLSNVEYKIELLHCFYMDCWQWLICVSKKEFKGDSAEQAWVQVYMWHKYYKTWNGQKWEDEK